MEGNSMVVAGVISPVLLVGGRAQNIFNCLLFFAGLLFGVFYASLALAERVDRDKPIHVEADRATVKYLNLKETNRISIFTGNVKLTQGTLIIRAEKVTMKEDVDGFRFVTALGNLVSFRQKREGLDEYIEAWAERVVFNSKTDNIELFKKARLKRGQDEVEGDYISYDRDSEFFQVSGSGVEGFETNIDNRVRMVIQPKNKSSGENEQTQ